MADIKISELTQVSALNNGDLVEVSQVNALAPSGYTSLKASMTDLGKKVNSDIEYTTDLADFTDKTTLGAIKETAKDKNVADEYDDTQTYDKGDVVIYKNTLYICTTNNTTGTWDASKWTATTVQSLIGDLSQLTTSVTSSLVGAVNAVDEKADSFIYTDSTVTDFITLFASIPNNKTVGFLMNSGTVSNCPVPYPTGVIAKWNSNTAFIELTQLNGTDASYIGRVFSGNLTWRKITTTAP